MTERVERRYALRQTVLEYLDLMADRQVVAARSAADGLGSSVVRHEVEDGGVVIVTSTPVPVDWLPAAIAGRLSEPPSVERTETWRAAGDAAESPLEFRFVGMPVPVSCSGWAVVRPAAAGPQSEPKSEMEARIDVRVDLPFLGGLVERAVAPQIASALDREADFLGSH